METPLLVELNDEWVAHLLGVAACRRLSGNEVRHILISVALPGARIPLKRLVIDAPPPVENGTIVLVRKGLIKCVKKDGGNWKKRPNGNKVREDHAKIICTKTSGYAAPNIPIVLNCYMSRMDVSNRTTGKGMLCRRRYVMEGSSFQLLHYLSDEEATDSAALAVKTYPHSRGNPLQLPLVGGKDDAMVGIEGLEPIATSTCMKQLNSNIGISSTYHGKSSSLSDSDLAHLLNFGEMSFPLEITILDVSPGWDFTFGGAKVLICLSHALPLGCFPCSDSIDVSVMFGSKNIVPCDVLGGQVLRCYSPPSCLQSGVGKVPLKVRIGGTDVLHGETSIFFEYRSAADLAFGMVRHLTQPSLSNSFQNYNKRQPIEDSRITKIRVVERLGEFAQTNNQIVTSLFPQKSSSTAVASHAETAGKSLKMESDKQGESFQSSEDDYSSMGADDGVFTAVEPSLPSCNGSLNRRSPVHLYGERFDDILDDSALPELDDSQLERLLNRLVVRVILQLAQIAATCGNLSGELGKRDSIGFALLHYACIYGNLQLVQWLIRCGADPMQHTGDDAVQTPLHLAAAAGHIEIFMQLLGAGVRPDARDAQGLTPSDVAFRMGHNGIGQWLGNLQQVVELQRGSLISETDHTTMFSESIDHHQKSGECIPSSPTAASSSSSITKSPSSPRLLLPKRSPEKNGSSDNLKTSQLIQNAFSSLSLHEKCAVCLSLFPKQNEDNSLLSPTGKEHCNGSETLQEVFSEIERKSLDVAMSVMRADELGNLEKQARIIQQNVRAWALRRNYTNMRNAVLTLQMFWRSRRSGRAQRLQQQTEQLEKDAVLQERKSVNINYQNLALEDVGGGGEEQLSPLHFSNLSQHIAASTQLQAAARGMLTRRQFARLKSEATTLLKLRCTTDPSSTTLPNI